jgi:hypothetical protein
VTRRDVAAISLASLLLVGLVWGIANAVSYRRRRLTVSVWRRLTRWEFWPPWIFYPPVVIYLIFLMIKHRSITLFTASNPSITAGGFVGESKFEILQGLDASRDRVARARLIRSDLSESERHAAVDAFVDQQKLRLPIVLKPDHGQRGSGVAIVRTWDDLRRLVRVRAGI